MAVGMFFLIVIGVCAFAMFMIIGLPFLAENRGRMTGQQKTELRNRRAQAKIAERALRQIANGTSGNPTYEAQIALDEINNYYDKELEA